MNEKFKYPPSLLVKRTLHQALTTRMRYYNVRAFRPES